MLCNEEGRGADMSNINNKLQTTASQKFSHPASQHCLNESNGLGRLTRNRPLYHCSQSGTHEDSVLASRVAPSEAATARGNSVHVKMVLETVWWYAKRFLSVVKESGSDGLFASKCIIVAWWCGSF